MDNSLIGYYRPLVIIVTNVFLLELTNICLSSTVFKYDEKIYKQIHGAPMGTSISGTLAEITRQSIENIFFDNVRLNYGDEKNKLLNYGDVLLSL